MVSSSNLNKEEAMPDVVRHRFLPPFWRYLFIAFTLISTFLAVNQIFGLELFVGVVLLDSRYHYLLLGLLLSLVFIIFPATPRPAGQAIPWYDYILFALTLGLSAYFAWNAVDIVEMAWEFAAPDEAIYMAILLWLVMLEAVRRAGGLAIFCIVLVISFYPLVADKVPAVVAGSSMSFTDAAAYHVFSAESLMGIPMRAFASLVFGFLIFGVALQKTGAGKFFLDFAFSLLGHVRGGPAKVAIFSSGLMGSVSGSVITNVLTTGVMTIPAMKRTGLPSRYAGGVEACASTGGVLMPPVMGATAFVMASFLGIPYIDIAIAAAIPSFLYFFGLFIQIDAFAARHKIVGIPREELPKVRQVLKEGWYYIAVFALLIFMLAYLRQEAFAPFYATVLLLAINQISPKHRMSWADFVEFIMASGRLLVELMGILGPIGLIVGALVATGMAGTFANDLVFIAGGAPLVLLLMGALTSFILGIGMTVTAAYIFLAVIMAPALVKVGMDPLAVHLFILYWGMLSFITPPVAIGAFAAASIAGANAMRTGLEAMRLGTIIYFIPFFFVFNPALIMSGPWFDVVALTGSAILGVVLLSAGLQGHLLFVGTIMPGALEWPTRVLLVISGLLFAMPGGELIGVDNTTLNIAGLVFGFPAALLIFGKRRTNPAQA
ncbi:MAG: TRAP transporter fused permease subunit [Gammaproteobacteria bacterium]|nr:TRAP transporter fused permease subunit [Gammaproteobacteria bacterium]